MLYRYYDFYRNSGGSGTDSIGTHGEHHIGTPIGLKNTVGTFVAIMNSALRRSRR